MTELSISLIPLKFCRKCGQSKPATLEYFRDSYNAKYQKRYLTSPCRACLRDDSTVYNRRKGIRSRSRVIVDGKQQCTICKTWKLATTEYFYRGGADKSGLHAACKACEKNKAQEKQRANPDARKRVISKYYRLHKSEILERSRKYNAEHPEKRQEQALKRVIENPEKVRGSARERTARYRANHTERVKELNRINVNKRRARKCEASGSYTSADIAVLLKSQKGLCWWCNNAIDPKNYHIDHRIPLARGGSNAPENLCISCPTCNMSKGAKLPQEWNGRLL